MYTVFVNEKPLYISHAPLHGVNNLKYESNNYFNQAVNQLQNSKLESINLYHHHLEKVWKAFKNHFRSIIAAGGVVKNQNNEILFIQRFQKWDLPKGKLEKGESIESTAKREVEEECGISNLIITKFLLTTYHIYFDLDPILKTTHWFGMNYNGNEPLVAQKEEGIEKAIWYPKNSIADLLQNTYKNIELLLKSYQET